MGTGALMTLLLRYWRPRTFSCGASLQLFTQVGYVTVLGISRLAYWNSFHLIISAISDTGFFPAVWPCCFVLSTFRQYST